MLLTLTLKIWRQANKNSTGHFQSYQVDNISDDMSFLEMLDVLNEDLIKKGQDPIAFESDCREGICGACSLMINGIPHGPNKATTTCQLHMRHFKDQDEIIIEPFRAKAFPIIKDLVVDRSAFDRIMSRGGFISANAGGAPDANVILIAKARAEKAFDAAACIGCGACVAACKNSSASLFVGAKVSHLESLPQGHPERTSRIVNMVLAMDQEQFGSCTNTLECEAVCPKSIGTEVIGRLNREFIVRGWSKP
jgi:succinate dehydrogenase / fumarate reductase iron-sulfur subunit